MDEKTKIFNAQKNLSMERATNTYNDIINENQNLTNNQMNQIDNFIGSETDRINQSVGSNINELEYAKQQAQNNYQRQVAGSVNDYNKYVMPPVSETARIGALNASQGRQLTAQDSFNNSLKEYGNQIERAKMSGDATIAQLALESLKTQLQLFTDSKRYGNQLAIDKLGNENDLSQDYWAREKDYMGSLNDVAQLTENQRKFNATQSYQKSQDKIENALAQKKYELDLKNAIKSSSSSSSSGGRSSSSSGGVALTDNSATLGSSQPGAGVAVGAGIGMALIGDKVKSNYTPVGLTNQALTWLYDINKSGAIGKADLEKKMKDALKNKIITEREANAIASSFGL